MPLACPRPASPRSSTGRQALVTSVEDQIVKACEDNTVLADKTFTFGPVSSMTSM